MSGGGAGSGEGTLAAERVGTVAVRGFAEGLGWLWRHRQPRALAVLLTVWNLAEAAWLAVLVLQRARTGRGGLRAGLAAGWTAAGKSWYAVPIAVLALCTPGLRDRLRFAVGAALAVAIVWGPSLLAAPRAMVREVVLDQIGRPRQPGLVHRLAGILGAHAAVGLHLRTVTLALTAAVALAVVLTLLTRGARVLAVLLLADARWSHVSSSLVAEVAALGGDVTDLVPAPVAEALAQFRVKYPFVDEAMAAELFAAGG